MNLWTLKIEFFSALVRCPSLVPGSSPTDPQTPKNSKTRKSDSKVTFTGTPKVTFESLFRVSMPSMSGRPGCWTMEMIGGSCASYLARTPFVPLFCTCLNTGGNRRAFRLPGEGGENLHCTWNLRPVVFGVECL